MSSRHKARGSTGVLVLVTGIAGSGKTALARSLARQVGAVLLEKDALQNPFCTDRESGFYRKCIQGPSYQALWDLAAQNLLLGHTVVVDSPLVRELRDPKWIGNMNRLSRQTHAPIVVVHCIAPAGVIQTRLRLRGEARDHRKLRQWNKFLKEQPIDVPIPWPHVKIDTSAPMGSAVRKAVEFLAKPTNGRAAALQAARRAS
jgi:predicted kinase